MRGLSARFLGAALAFGVLPFPGAQAGEPATLTDPAAASFACARPDTAGKLALCFKSLNAGAEEELYTDQLNDQIAAIAEDNPRLYIEIMNDMDSVTQDDALCQSVPSLQEKLDRALSEEAADAPLGQDFQEQATVILSARAACAQKYAAILAARPETSASAENFIRLSQSHRALSNVISGLKLAP